MSREAVIDKKYFEIEIQCVENFEISFYTIKTNEYNNFCNNLTKFILDNLLEVVCTEMGFSKNERYKNSVKENMEREFKINYSEMTLYIKNNVLSEFILYWLIKQSFGDSVIEFWSSQLYRNRSGDSQGGIDVLCYDKNDELVIIGESKHTSSIDSYSTAINELVAQFLTRLSFKNGIDTFGKLKENFERDYEIKIESELPDNLHRIIADKIGNIYQKLNSNQNIGNLVKCIGITSILFEGNYIEKIDGHKKRILNYISKNSADIIKSIKEADASLTKLAIYIFPRNKEISYEQ